MPRSLCPRTPRQAHDTYETTLTLSNTMFGAAILTFPYTVYRVGWLISIPLIALAFGYSIFGFNAIIDAAHFTQERSIKGILQSVLGPRVALCVDVCMVVHMVGILIVYVSVGSDYVHSAIEGFSHGALDFSTEYIKIIVGVILIPLAFLRNVSRLSFIASVAAFLVVLTVCSVVVYFFISVAKHEVRYAGTTEGQVSEAARALDASLMTCPTEGCKVSFPSPLNSIFPAHGVAWMAVLEIIRRLSVFMPLFGCQVSIAPLFGDLKGSPAQKRLVFKRSLLISAIFVLTLQVLNAGSGVLMFADKLQPNILMTFPSAEIYMTVVKLLYAGVVLIIMVLKLLPLRIAVLSWFSLKKDEGRGKLAFYLIGLGTIVIAVILSIFVPNIDTVFNSVSALFGIVTYWLLPLFLLYKRPYLEANSKAPVQSLVSSANGSIVEDETGPSDTPGVGFLAFLGFSMVQARAVDRAFRGLPRERILAADDLTLIRRIEAKYTGHRSLPASDPDEEDITFAQQNIEAIAHTSAEPSELSQFPEDSRSSSKVAKLLNKSHRRRNSVSELKPTYNYKIAASSSGQDEGEEAIEENDQDERAALLGLPTTEVEHQNNTSKLVAKMTRGRKAAAIVAATIIVLLNGCAFFLSTFVDTDTFEFVFSDK
ncbi:Amino acid transporter family [Giardia muris]|uniref:Amino acid transporter family n=1 Tax=Giardia muris TaxID=5742 RepID=A0A4Z1STW4_GIAMU|nr:Amino acid transporter family [Giardia muris]|eukprot:TNJ29180.1 Amino acid transporter family [Giardia muris]